MLYALHAETVYLGNTFLPDPSSVVIQNAYVLEILVFNVSHISSCVQLLLDENSS